MQVTGDTQFQSTSLSKTSQRANEGVVLAFTLGVTNAP